MKEYASKIRKKFCPISVEFTTGIGSDEQLLDSMPLKLVFLCKISDVYALILDLDEWFCNFLCNSFNTLRQCSNFHFSETLSSSEEEETMLVSNITMKTSSRPSVLCRRRTISGPLSLRGGNGNKVIVMNQQSKVTKICMYQSIQDWNEPKM